MTTTITSKLIATTLLAATAALTASATTATAGDRWRYEFDKRADRQMDLIQEGRSDGTITRAEAYHLTKTFQNIARQRRIFAADGEIDGYEANEIREDQDRLSNAIFVSRNNAERSRRWWWRTASY